MPAQSRIYRGQDALVTFASSDVVVGILQDWSLTPEFSREDLRGAGSPKRQDDQTTEVEVAIDAGVLRGHADPGTSASQIATITDVTGDDVTVEYGSSHDPQQGTVGVEWVRETTLEEGDDVVVTYDSKYTADDAPRTEKSGTVRCVHRRRGSFQTVAVDLDAVAGLPAARRGTNLP